MTTTKLSNAALDQVLARARVSRLPKIAEVALRAHIAALEQELADARKERDEWQQRALNRDLQVVTLSSERDTALLEEHRKAVVRARNEGLEKAAVRFDSTGHFWVSQILRATKEPEQ